MQNPIYRFILCVLGISLLASCKNDVEIAADWKEIAIVYGLLNPTDDVNYIRIQRAYLDETLGAMQFSDEPDSLYFDTLSVTVTEWKNGREEHTYRLTRVDGSQIGIPKDSGVFQNDVNYLYELKGDIKPSTFANTYSYKLTIFNPRTGYLVQSSALSVGMAEIDAPASENSTDLVILTNDKFQIIADIQEAKFARSYDMTMRIRVEEINVADSTQREIKELDWAMFKHRKTNSLRGFEEAVYFIPATNFFAFIGSQLEENPNVKRRLLGFDVLLYGAGEDLYTYINVNEPSLGIVQKKPEYTNIENGFGLFSSRTINRVMDRQFEIRTKQALMISDKTKHLGFVNY